MKKIKLSDIDKSEVLSREELKNILDSESGSGSHKGSGSRSGSGSRKGSGSKPGSLPPKRDACWDLPPHSRCSYVDNTGKTQYGCCQSFQASPLFCSTLDTSCWNGNIPAN